MASIRAAGPDDAAALEHVRGRSWRKAYAGLLPDEVIEQSIGPGSVQRQRDFLAEDAERHALLAEDDGQPVGMAVFGPDRDLPGGDTDGWSRVELYSIYVVPEHWSTGVGRDLADRVIATAAAAGHERLSLWVAENNERARSFYARAGFAATGDRKLQEELTGPVAQVRYERAL